MDIGDVLADFSHILADYALSSEDTADDIYKIVQYGKWNLEGDEGSSDLMSS